MKYMIVQTVSLKGLEFQVNQYIKLGWIPEGGILHIPSRIDSTTYCQVMVKK